MTSIKENEGNREKREIGYFKEYILIYAFIYRNIAVQKLQKAENGSA